MERFEGECWDVSARMALVCGMASVLSGAASKSLRKVNNEGRLKAAGTVEMSCRSDI